MRVRATGMLCVDVRAGGEGSWQRLRRGRSVVWDESEGPVKMKGLVLFGRKR